MYVNRTLKPDFFDLVLYFQVTGGVLPFLSTMATQRVLPQSKETLLQSYNKRLKDDIKSILENFTEIIKTAKVCRANALSTAKFFSNCVVYVTSLSSVRFSPTIVSSYTIEKKKNCMLFLQIEDETQVSRPTQAEQDHYEMHVRAANIVCICHNRLRGVKICFKISWSKLQKTIILQSLHICLFCLSRFYMYLVLYVFVITWFGSLLLQLIMFIRSELHDNLLFVYFLLICRRSELASHWWSWCQIWSSSWSWTTFPR